MPGKRETILSYLVTLLAKVPGVVTVARDRGNLLGIQRPAIILLDGVQERVTEVRGHSLTMMPAAVMALKPEIFLIAKSRDDASNLTLEGQPAPIGPELSDWHDKIVGTLANDINLAALLGSNGQVIFESMDTDMRTENTLEGMILFRFAFNFVLDPAKL